LLILRHLASRHLILSFREFPVLDWISPESIHFSSVFHRRGGFVEKVNQIEHDYPPVFCLGGDLCLLIHGQSWHNPSKSGSSVPVPRAEFAKGGVRESSSKVEFETQRLTGSPTGARKSDQL
jgi:hypothetical protein